MKNAIIQLDRLLRGDATRMDALRGGKLQVSVRSITSVGVILGVIYGLCMGVFSLTSHGSQQHMQIFASAVKVPLLFFMTLVVTFPSLYVFNALMGSRLVVILVLRLLVSSIGIMMAILASLGPIVAFFSLTTTSYSFMTLLNVVVFALAGLLGGAFLLRTLQRLTLAAEIAAEEEVRRTAPVPPQVEEPPVLVLEPEMPMDVDKAAAQARIVNPPPIVPPPIPGAHSPITRPNSPAMQRVDVGIIFKIWVVVFGLVGAQMAWIMRPFIGYPNAPFTWFRSTDSNFFEGVWTRLHELFSW